MRTIVIIILASAISLSITGCATIYPGWKQKVMVTSDPSGAAVQVDDKDSYMTPARILMKRNRDHEFKFSLDGYKPQTIRIAHAISGAFCGNVFLGGPVGMALDSLSGAMYKLVPGEVHAVLEKAE